jgi:hypothetical protein
MRTCVLASFVVLIAAGFSFAQPKSAAIDKELKAFYEKGTSPAWSEAIKQLTAEKADQRSVAAKYLAAMLQQAQMDELSGKAPWRATPFWGSSGENPARNLRHHIADEMAKAPASPATLTVVRWYVDNEKVPRFQEAVLSALEKVDGKEGDDFRLSLLDRPHENSVIVLSVLKQIEERKAPIAEAVLGKLCDHYRPSLRTTARQLNKRRGGAEPAAFDPAKAMQRPELTKLMLDVGALLDEPAGTTAPFVRVTTKWTDGKETDVSRTIGWLIKDDGDSWVVRTPFGHREKFQKESKLTRRGKRGSGV